MISSHTSTSVVPEGNVGETKAELPERRVAGRRKRDTAELLPDNDETPNKLYKSRKGKPCYLSASEMKYLSRTKSRSLRPVRQYFQRHKKPAIRKKGRASVLSTSEETPIRLATLRVESCSPKGRLLRYFVGQGSPTVGIIEVSP